MNGKKNWYIVDGYRPPVNPGEATDYEGHECIMILNCNDQDANIFIDVYFTDRPPVEGIPFVAPAKRVTAFRSNDRKVFGDLYLDVGVQYSLRIRSDVDVVVQYGRLDVNQPNMAYLATLGYGQ
ncbi:MAG TPA: hypothetical protein GXX36_01335 [Clostridiaceae bacterium]|nr:hypothetical protein [Clostridiaceae bacterium]